MAPSMASALESGARFRLVGHLSSVKVQCRGSVRTYRSSHHQRQPSHRKLASRPDSSRSASLERGGRDPRGEPSPQAAPDLGGPPVSQTRSGFSQLALADTLNAVAWARRHAVDVLRRWRVPPDTIQTARLIVSELMTNAIRHTHTDEEVSPYSPLSPVRKVTLPL
ncbi:ATP-binding protein [Kitasatospora sp. NPDC088351]|uniref:ATP-binding protein n=1 Tax=Kitasatospora sp. NPDC088351 TaxID=3155180 RepID=UPI00341F4774